MANYLKQTIAYCILCMSSIAACGYLYHYNIESKLAELNQQLFINSIHNNITALFYLIPEKKMPDTIALLQAKTKTQILQLQLNQLYKQGFEVDTQMTAIKASSNVISLLLKENQKLDSFSFNVSNTLDIFPVAERELFKLEYNMLALDLETQDKAVIQKLQLALQKVHINLAAADAIKSYSPEASLFYLSLIAEPLALLSFDSMEQLYNRSEPFEPRIKARLMGIISPILTSLKNTELVTNREHDFSRMRELQQQVFAMKEPLSRLPAIAKTSDSSQDIALVIALLIAFISALRICILWHKNNNQPLSSIKPFQETQDHLDRQKAIMDLIRQQEQLKKQIAQNEQNQTRVAPANNPDDDDMTRIMP